MVFSLIYLLALICLTVAIIITIKKSPKLKSAAELNIFRRLAIYMVGLLIVQFFAGMVVNLWTKLPSNHPGTNAHEYFRGVYTVIRWVLTGSGIAALVIHVSIALLLIAMGVTFIIIAIAKRNRFWIIVNAIGALFLQGALFNGASFLNYKEQLSSLLMAIFFVLAISTYIIGLYLSKPVSKVLNHKPTSNT